MVLLDLIERCPLLRDCTESIGKYIVVLGKKSVLYMEVLLYSVPNMECPLSEVLL